MFKTPASQPPQVSQQLQPKKHPIRPISSDQSPKYQQNSHATKLPITKTFFIQQKASATTTLRPPSSPTLPRCVSIDRAHQRVVARFTNQTTFPRRLSIPNRQPRVTNHHYRHYHRNHCSSRAAQRYPTTRPTR